MNKRQTELSGANKKRGQGKSDRGTGKPKIKKIKGTIKNGGKSDGYEIDDYD